MTVKLPPLAALTDESSALSDLNPAPRLMMGPGPINADPRVLRAMSSQLLGQFDPQFRRMMKETMVLYRRVFETRNDWTFIIDGTARSGIETVMASVIESSLPLAGVDAQTLHELSHLTLRNWNGIEVGELRASPVLADLRLH